MTAIRFSVPYAVFALCLPMLFAAQLISKPMPTFLPTVKTTKIGPTPILCQPTYRTRITASGETERILQPCVTPDPCRWPVQHAGTSRLSIAYPPDCCRILYRQLSTSRTSLHPLPYPCGTPPPRPTQKPECAPCTSGSQCLQGKCWGSPLKCTDGGYHGLLRCGFKDECDACTSGLQCATKKCWKSKCVFDTEESKKTCFPH